MLTPIPLLMDAAAYGDLATVLLLGVVLYNPRLMLQDYPPAIQKIVHPKTDREKNLTL